MAEFIEHERAASLTRSICDKLSLVGYVGIEFKRDPSDGCYKILEVTPARFETHSGITEASAVNVALAWYDHLTGTDRECSLALGNGKRWVSEMNDLRALLPYLHAGSWSVSSWLKSYQGVRGWEIFARDDLGPTIALPRLAASHLLRRGVASIFKAIPRPN